MYKHSIEIEFIKSSGEITDISFSSPANNISSSDTKSLANANAYTKGFLLNLNDLSGNYEYFGSDNVKYYISSVQSDENKDISITLKITTSNVVGATLLFPNEIYPTLISINNIDYSNSNEVFQFPTSSNGENVETTLIFKKMNKENVPLIILSINSGITITYDDRYIKSMTRGSQLSTDNEYPKYEVVSQYGSISFFDSDYALLNLKSTTNLQKPRIIKILLNDKVIGTYKATSWQYDMLTSIVTIELSDSLNELSEVEVSEHIELSSTKTLYDVFLDIKSLLENIGEVFSTIDDTLVNRLKNINMYIYRYNATNLQELVNNFCSVAQCSIYKNEVGELEVFSWR